MASGSAKASVGHYPSDLPLDSSHCPSLGSGILEQARVMGSPSCGKQDVNLMASLGSPPPGREPWRPQSPVVLPLARLVLHGSAREG